MAMSRTQEPCHGDIHLQVEPSPQAAFRCRALVIRAGGRRLEPILAVDEYLSIHYIGGMAVTPMTGQAFLVPTALAEGSRHTEIAG